MDVVDKFYKKAMGVRRPSGAVLMDGKHIADTVQCGHCGGHWVEIVGSGAHRGFCTLCNKKLCGKKACMRSCIPAEKQIELVENGKYIIHDGFFIPL